LPPTSKNFSRHIFATFATNMAKRASFVYLLHKKTHLSEFVFSRGNPQE